jgi:beta-N-acetylhexosaminidase
MCGQLLVGGFQGTTLPTSITAALAREELGGVILFKRNLPSEVTDVRALTGAAASAAPELPPFVCIDQEGGRVARLGAPVVALPPMRALAATGNVNLLRRAGAVLGSDLRALGFSSGLAPILDVDSNPANPIIGDRAFGKDPGSATRYALAFAEGLREGGVAACGKHFPGHGDTERDSHYELPVVRHDRARLDAIELAPFAAAARGNIDAFMTAHVVYTALDDARPATLSPRIATTLLREELGFTGVLFSDDLEMKALSAPVEETAVEAVRAGCDALLICSDEALLARARDALVHAAERDSAFRSRCESAFERFSALRRRYPPRPIAADPELRAHFDSGSRRAFEAGLARALASVTEGT